MEIKIVLGAFFGDEGKGVTTQWLCRKAIKEGKKPIVIRYSGGCQAGHTVVNNGVKHICSTYGAGTLLGVPTYWMSNDYNAFLNPISAYYEYRDLAEKIDVVPQVFIRPSSLAVVTPYDVFHQQNDEVNLSHGSCGKGIWSCLKRTKFPDIPRFPDIHENSNSSTINPSAILEECHEYYNMVNDEWDDDFLFACKFFSGYSDKSTPFKYTYIPPENMADVLIFEGSQGLLLDARYGLNPHTTPSRVGLNGILDKYLGHNTEVYLVSRPYVTRHGNGYEPISCDYWFDIDKGSDTNQFNEFQGEFKVGRLEDSLFLLAMYCHQLMSYDVKFNCVVTHVDEYRIKTDQPGIKIFEKFAPIKPHHLYVNDSQESNLSLIL